MANIYSLLVVMMFSGLKWLLWIRFKGKLHSAFSAVEQIQVSALKMYSSPYITGTLQKSKEL